MRKGCSRQKDGVCKCPGVEPSWGVGGTKEVQRGWSIGYFRSVWRWGNGAALFPFSKLGSFASFSCLISSSLQKNEAVSFAKLNKSLIYDLPFWNTIWKHNINLLVPPRWRPVLTTTTNTDHPIIIIYGQDLARGWGRGGRIKPGWRRWRNGNTFKIPCFVVYY